MRLDWSFGMSTIIYALKNHNWQLKFPLQSIPCIKLRISLVFRWQAPILDFKASFTYNINLFAINYFCYSQILPLYSVTNDQVTRYSSLIAGIYDLWHLTHFSKTLVLKSLFISKMTKIGLKLSMTSHIKLKSKLKI